MVVSRKSIHEREDHASRTIINDLIDKGCRVVVLGTSFVKIAIIYVDTDGPLFLGNRNEVRNPFHQRDKVDKARF